MTGFTGLLQERAEGAYRSIRVSLILNSERDRVTGFTGLLQDRAEGAYWSISLILNSERDRVTGFTGILQDREDRLTGPYHSFLTVREIE